MISQTDLQYLNGAGVHTLDGERIGSAGRVYLDDRTGEPEWIGVHLSEPGTADSFVPLGRATLTGDRIEVPFGRDLVEGAARIHPGGELGASGADLLRAHYGMDAGDPDPAVGGAVTPPAERPVAATRSARLRKYSVTEQEPTAAPQAIGDAPGPPGGVDRM